MRVTIRELRWDDFDDLVASYFKCYDDRAAGLPVGIVLFGERPTLAAEVAWFAGLYREVADGSAVVAIAEVDGHAVGNCTITRAAPTADSESAHVGGLGILVDREHRRQGIGRALLQHALEACGGKFDLVRLSVLEWNLAARRLYESLGFRAYGILPQALRRGSEYVSSVEMWRWVGPIEKSPPEPAAERAIP